MSSQKPPAAIGLNKAGNKPQLTDADKALLEAEPDWERMSEGAKRLLNAKPDRHGTERVRPKR